MTRGGDAKRRDGPQQRVLRVHPGMAGPADLEIGRRILVFEQEGKERAEVPWAFRISLDDEQGEETVDSRKRG